MFTLLQMWRVYLQIYMFKIPQVVNWDNIDNNKNVLTIALFVAHHVSSFKKKNNLHYIVRQKGVPHQCCPQPRPSITKKTSPSSSKSQHADSLSLSFYPIPNQHLDQFHKED